MNYKIPDDIKFLCSKNDLSDSDEQESVKQEFVRFLKWYLDLKRGKNSLANITDIVRDDKQFPVKATNYPFERDVAGRMMRTRDYTMKEGLNENGKKEVYVIAADRDWWVKYSFWIALGLSLLGFALGLLSEPLKNKFFPNKQANLDTATARVLGLKQILFHYKENTK